MGRVIPAFDQWFARKSNGASFDEMHMKPGMFTGESLRELTRQMREYTTEMVRQAVSKNSGT